MERVRQAVILCAGAGKRMGPKYKDKQKCTLTIAGEGKPIIMQTVERAMDCGIEEILLLTGHKAKQVEACFNNFIARKKINFVYCGDPSLRPMNNLEMLAKAKIFLKPPLLCIHGNLLFKKSVISSSLETYRNMSPGIIINMASQILTGVTHYGVVHDEEMNIKKLLNETNGLPTYMGIDVFSANFLKFGWRKGSPMLKQLFEQFLPEIGKAKANLYQEAWFHLTTESDLKNYSD